MANCAACYTGSTICSIFIAGVTWKFLKPSPLDPLPQERETRKISTALF